MCEITGHSVRHIVGWVGLFATLCCGLLPTNAHGEAVKFICAVQAAAPPIIDGVLDDACWQHAEVRDDFAFVQEPKPRRTTIRCAFDAQHLYVAAECFTDDPADLAQGIAAARAVPGFDTILRKGFVGFTNRQSLELFLDPGCSLRNHYQLLYNAAGGIRGGYRNRFDHAFSPTPSFKASVGEGVWRSEFVFPLQTNEGGRPLHVGDRWGINVARNDALPLAIWRPILGAWNEPKLFGIVLMGDYRQWWEAVWTQGARADLARMADAMPAYTRRSATVQRLYTLTAKRAKPIDALARKYPPTSRANFERLFVAYTDFERHYHRLKALCATLDLLR
jgi:hypothetical protein